jgi:hypothetical protein
MVASALPPELDPDRHRDLRGRLHEPWARRAFIVVLSAVAVLAIADLFGEGETTTSANGAGTMLKVQVPKAVRGGLFFQGRIDVTARRTVQQPTLVLGPGWTEQMQLNTIEPSPTSEVSRAGRLHLTFDTLDPGQRLTVWLQLEANPTGPGHRDTSVELLDGHRTTARTHTDITVFP